MVMSPKERREFVLKHTCWKPAFSFLPHTCLLTKKWLWLKWCYAGDYSPSGISSWSYPIIRKRWWANSKELMLLKLKGE